MPHPDLRLAAGIMKPSGDRARRWKKPSMTPHSVQTDPAASDKQFCRGFHFVNPSAKAGLPLMPARAVSRTETIGSVITIMFSGSKLIVFGRHILSWRPELT